MTKDELKITNFMDNKDYVFISYSSADEEKVFNEYVIPLQEKYGLRVFCDMDFKNHANQTWTKQMKNNLMDAKACLLFVSSSYLASYACLLEVLVATYRKIPILKIQLEKPNVTKNYDEGNEISPSTINEFVNIGKQLENAANNIQQFKDACNCYIDVKEFIEVNRSITKYSVSRAFKEYYEKIPGTRLDKQSGLDAIKTSLAEISISIFEDTKNSLAIPSQSLITEKVEVAKPNNSTTEPAIVQIPPSPIIPPMPTTSSDGKRYRYKGGKYDATIRVDCFDDKQIYIVETSSQIAPSWKDWVGIKKKEEIITGQYVNENNVVTKEVSFDSVSTTAKFITGVSTNGSGMLVEKNLIASATVSPSTAPSVDITPTIQTSENTVTFEYTVNHTDAQYKIITLGKQGNMGQAVNVTVECNGKIYNKKTHSTAGGRVDGFGEIYSDNGIYENDKLLVTCDFALKKIIIQKIASAPNETEAVEKVVLPSQGIVSKYHYKGGKYDAIVRVEFNNGNEIYIVEASSQIAPSWTDWVGVKKREEIVTGHYVASNNIVIKEVAFDSVSTAAKFITGTSTNGGGMLTPKNLISE